MIQISMTPKQMENLRQLLGRTTMQGDEAYVYLELMQLFGEATEKSINPPTDKTTEGQDAKEGET